MLRCRTWLLLLVPLLGCGDSFSASSAGQGGGGGQNANGVGGNGAPLCGNAELDDGEECDDGNTAANDGCTNCVYDCAGEGELKTESGSCYRLIKQEANWTTARDNCAALGTGFYLAVLTPIGEIDQVAPLLTERTWIGANDREEEGDWRWVNDQRWTYRDKTEPWEDNEPNNFYGEDCVEIDSEGLLNDRGCETTRVYVCERSLTR